MDTFIINSHGCGMLITKLCFNKQVLGVFSIQWLDAFVWESLYGAIDLNKFK